MDKWVGDVSLATGSEGRCQEILSSKSGVIRSYDVSRLRSFEPETFLPLPFFQFRKSAGSMLSREEATAILLEERLSLTGYVITVVRSFHLAEDIFQDICVKSLLHHDLFESRAQLLKWARVSCRNRAIDIIRSRDGRYRGLSEEVLDSLLEVWGDEDEDDILKGTRDALAHCLNELTENNRRILQLRYFEGRSGIDVAQILGRKPMTVYQALARIHNMLEKCIQVRLAIVGSKAP